MIPLATIIEYPLSFGSLDYPHLLTPTAADAKRGETASYSAASVLTVAAPHSSP